MFFLQPTLKKIIDLFFNEHIILLNERYYWENERNWWKMNDNFKNEQVILTIAKKERFFWLLTIKWLLRYIWRQTTKFETFKSNYFKFYAMSSITWTKLCLKTFSETFYNKANKISVVLPNVLSNSFKGFISFNLT